MSLGFLYERMVPGTYILVEGPTMNNREVNHPGLTWTGLTFAANQDVDSGKGRRSPRANPRTHAGTNIHRFQIQHPVTHVEVGRFTICCMPHPRYLVSAGGESFLSKHVNLIDQMYSDIELPMLEVQDFQWVVAHSHTHSQARGTYTQHNIHRKWRNWLQSTNCWIWLRRHNHYLIALVMQYSNACYLR